LRGWMQSTGQTSTHAVSFTPMQGSQMIYAIPLLILAYHCDPALTALFTPRHPQVGRYEVCTTETPIDAVAAGSGEPAGSRRSGGSGGSGTSGGSSESEARIEIDALEALDAFGAAGSYDRSALAQLYGATRVRVARVWTKHDDRFESLTLLSPYPDASLTHLLPGTMVIRFTIEARTPEPGPRPAPRTIIPIDP
jgi:hypothetical protein